MTVEEGHLGAVYQAQVADGVLLVSGFADLLDRRQEQADEHRDNRDYHQQLDERESIWFVLIA